MSQSTYGRRFNPFVLVRPNSVEPHGGNAVTFKEAQTARGQNNMKLQLLKGTEPFFYKEETELFKEPDI